MTPVSAVGHCHYERDDGLDLAPVGAVRRVRDGGSDSPQFVQYRQSGCTSEPHLVQRIGNGCVFTADATSRQAHTIDGHY
jgi:hypothetical protein